MKKLNYSYALILLVLGFTIYWLSCGKKGEVSSIDFEAKKEWPQPLSNVLEVAVTKAEKLIVLTMSKNIETNNPYAKHWKQAPYVEVQLLPQQVTAPSLQQTTISALKVQSITDGATIAFRVAWDDEEPDGNVATGRFSDGVALEFPLTEGATPMMGLGGKVQILYWKALWQKDIDVGFQDVQDLHPNYWVDLYWFAEGTFPFPIPEAFKDPQSLTWFVAQQAGNPMAVFSRTEPIEELVAAGWGTLTHQDESVSTGKGAWVDKHWAVVISRPLKTSDAMDYQFDTSGSNQIAFAVWQGSDNNVGGRKHWSNWVDFTFQ